MPMSALEIRDPELVRTGRGEVALDQVGTSIRPTPRDRGAWPLGLADPSQSLSAHEPLDGAARDYEGFPTQLSVHLLPP